MLDRSAPASSRCSVAAARTTPAQASRRARRVAPVDALNDERRLLLAPARDLDRLSSSSSSSLLAPPPRSFGGGSFDPSEGLADAAEDLLRALRSEPESSGSGIGSGSNRSDADGADGDGDRGTEEEETRRPGRGVGRAARRADELAADGMWPLYQVLGDFADLLDLANRGSSVGDEDDEEFDDENGAISLGGASADAEALSLLRSHPSLLLLPRNELARRLVLLKTAAGPGADAAALARKLPWLLTHADPGEVVRAATKQMLALMPGVGGPAELGARLFGSNGGKGGKKRRSSDGRASQSWLTFADIARGESRKIKVEEKERENEREEL